MKVTNLLKAFLLMLIPLLTFEQVLGQNDTTFTSGGITVTLPKTWETDVHDVSGSASYPDSIVRNNPASRITLSHPKAGAFIMIEKNTLQLVQSFEAYSKYVAKIHLDIDGKRLKHRTFEWKGRKVLENIIRWKGEIMGEGHFQHHDWYVLMDDNAITRITFSSNNRDYYIHYKVAKAIMDSIEIE
jgi:hypothetical protein